MLMRSVIPMVLLVGVLGLLVYGFFALMEPYEESVDRGWGKAALLNPYLAIEQFGSAMNMRVASSYNFASLKSLPDGGTVFISNTGDVLTHRNVEKLVAWMQSGGHLIVAAPYYDEDNPDMLLQIYGVRKLVVEDEGAIVDQDIKLSETLENINAQESDAQQSGNGQVCEIENLAQDELTALTFNGVKSALQVHFSAASKLDHAYLHSNDDSQYSGVKPSYWAGDKFGTHFMQFNVGDGMLSVLSDKTIWQSERAGQFDHAYLFWMLSDSDTDTVILYGASMPSVFYLLWHHAAELIVICALWLLAWIYYRSRRFGPMRGINVAVRRSMAEHIRASAEYLWRYGEGEQLLALARQDLQQQMQRLPAINTLSTTDVWQLMSERSGVAINKVAAALATARSGNEREFAVLMSTIQKIRNSI